MIKILPPTRTARQLAAWVNAHPVVDGGRRRVRAKVERSHSSTDRQIGRLRWPGKGRSGVRLTLYAYDSNNDRTGASPLRSTSTIPVRPTGPTTRPDSGSPPT